MVVLDEDDEDCEAVAVAGEAVDGEDDEAAVEDDEDDDEAVENDEDDEAGAVVTTKTKTIRKD